MTAAGYPQQLAEMADFLESQERSERIEFLIEFAERFHTVPERVAIRPFQEKNKVPACESEAYAWAEEQSDATLKFHFAVENPQGISAMAMAVILGETLSGAPVAEVSRVPTDIIYQIFGRELSMGKSMGLMGMVSMVQNYAKKHLSQLR